MKEYGIHFTIIWPFFRLLSSFGWFCCRLCVHLQFNKNLFIEIESETENKNGIVS